MPKTLETFRRDGIAVLPSVCAAACIDRLVGLCEPLLAAPASGRRRAGVRRVFERAPKIMQELVGGDTGQLLRDIAGSNTAIIRAILFDKTPETNWFVPWHQDATIAVSERIEVPGFGPWAVKDGEHHCQPPLEVMESIVTVRIHLDENSGLNGPLRVIKGSHTRGLLSDDEIASVVSNGEVIEARVPRGGIVLTTPLAVHSSPRSTDPAARRRVLHLDISNIELPGGLRWAEEACLLKN